MSVKLITRYVKDFVGEHELAAIEPQVQDAQKVLLDRNGSGSDFLG